MDRLTAARERLYGASPQGSTRAMLVRFTKAGNWEALANLYQAIQEELELPAPAISVSGDRGYGLWFSLAEPVALNLASDFLDALRGRYLAEIRPAGIELLPEISKLPAVPAQQGDSDRWSAYIDPTLGGMFTEEPWLEMAPNTDKQADLLAGLQSIKSEDFQQALKRLQEMVAGVPALPEPTSVPPVTTRRRRATLNVGGHFADPHSFLLAVMNDESASPRQRIRAAKALLPYFANQSTT